MLPGARLLHIASLLSYYDFVLLIVMSPSIVSDRNPLRSCVAGRGQFRKICSCMRADQSKIDFWAPLNISAPQQLTISKLELRGLRLGKI